MTTVDHSKIRTCQKHIHALAEEIGPRGSTTEAERKASVYCADVLRRLNLSPQMETFSSARSIYTPHLVTAAALLAAFAIYPLAGVISAALAAAISATALISDLLELSFRSNPLRWLTPKGSSQNVIAKIRPSGDHRQDLILIGHVDSHRAPIIFSSSRWVNAYKAFTTVAFLAFSAQTLLYMLGAFTQWGWIWPLSAISAGCALLLAAMCIQANLSHFSPGANDNASAVGLVLTLAEVFKETPLKHTRLWIALTGCEEVQHYGAQDFFRRHRTEFHNPSALILEMVGCDGPAWLRKEGIVIPFHASRELTAQIEDLSRDHPEWQAHPAYLSGGNTEMADAIQAGVPAITFIGADEKGNTPFWHQMEDRVDKMDPDVLARTYDMTLTFVRTLDRTVPD